MIMWQKMDKCNLERTHYKSFISLRSTFMVETINLLRHPEEDRSIKYTRRENINSL